jgi:hypothetical protein
MQSIGCSGYCRRIPLSWDSSMWLCGVSESTQIYWFVTVPNPISYSYPNPNTNPYSNTNPNPNTNPITNSNPITYYNPYPNPNPNPNLNLKVRNCAAPDSDGEAYTAVSELDVVAMCDKCLKIYNSDATTKGLILNALVKLSVRVSSSAKKQIRELILPFKSSMSLELQQRSSEYSVLLDTQWESLRGEVLGKMPVLDEAALRKKRSAFTIEDTAGDFSPMSLDVATSSPALTIKPVGNGSKSAVAQAISSSSRVEVSSSNGSLLDLDDIFGSNSSVPPIQPTPSSFGNQQQAPMDLLSDIFSSTMISPTISPLISPTLSTPSYPPTPPLGDMNLLNQGLNQGMGQQNSMLQPSTAAIVVKAYEKAGLQVSSGLG